MSLILNFKNPLRFFYFLLKLEFSESLEMCQLVLLFKAKSYFCTK